MIKYDIKTLIDVPFSKLYNLSKLGFNDYDINVDITEEILNNLFKSYGYSENYSLGIYIKNKIIGFIFNGINNKEKTAYNAGIAMLPGFRGNGIGTQLFAYSVINLKTNGFKKYYLECMKDNEEALNFYIKRGMNIEREFSCWAINTSKIKNLRIQTKETFQINESDLSALTLLDKYAETKQSWQYRNESIINIKDKYKIFKAVNYSDNIVGIIVFDPELGAVAKLITNYRFRKIGVASMLLKEASKYINSKEITFINIDRKNVGLEKFLEKLNFDFFATQYELLLDLEKD